MTGGVVALATASRLPAGMRDTAGLVQALAAVGTTAEVVVWDDRCVDWDRYALVVTHSTWDWLDHRSAFRAWLAGLAARRALATPITLLEWCEDKAYLFELATRGVTVPDGLLLDRGRGARSEVLRSRLGDRPLVVKPSVGGGGHRVVRCGGPAEAARAAVERMPLEPVLVQAFEPAVIRDGEYSAVFVEGELSHVVRKKPRPGDFRVHGRYGATREPVPGAAWIARYGRQVLAQLDGSPLYARVDFVLAGPARPVLMELELLEPDLYLREAPGATERLAEALAHRAAAAGRLRAS